MTKQLGGDYVGWVLLDRWPIFEVMPGYLLPLVQRCSFSHSPSKPVAVILVELSKTGWQNAK